MTKYISSLLMSVLIMSCASTGQVKTDFDPAVEFFAFKTYAITEPQIQDDKDILNNSLLRSRIEGLVDQNLALKGLKRVNLDQSPDLLVRYWVGVKDKTTSQYIGSASYGSYGAYGPYWDGRWGPMYDQYVTYDYKEGTLILDLLNPSNKNLVWRAYLQQVLSDKDTNYKNAEINLRKAFQDYPPKIKTEK